MSYYTKVEDVIKKVPIVFQEGMKNNGRYLAARLTDKGLQTDLIVLNYLCDNMAYSLLKSAVYLFSDTLRKEDVGEITDILWKDKYHRKIVQRRLVEALDEVGL